ncbi:MAG: AraC family transcriptional regulator [Prolixibacteraceae bacterium]|nr:AraC family transcriptional regulator [Prolixibacteraceae bacterium]
MKLYIKNMVSKRCKIIVKSELETLGLHCSAIDLCEVEIVDDISEDKRLKLDKKLRESGFELISERNIILTEKIKTIIIELVHYNENQLVINLSDYLSIKLKYSYTYLANIYSKNQGETIEHFFITNKIEKVKELLIYEDLNITEIADKLHFSSVAHLSNLFKKITGITPSQYKQLCFFDQKPPKKKNQ